MPRLDQSLEKNTIADSRRSLNKQTVLFSPMVNPLKFLWNGGLDPDTASLISLRGRDNIYIISASFVLLISLYPQA